MWVICTVGGCRCRPPARVSISCTDAGQHCWPGQPTTSQHLHEVGEVVEREWLSRIGVGALAMYEVGLGMPTVCDALVNASNFMPVTFSMMAR
jgi:hypothetical protein